MALKDLSAFTPQEYKTFLDSFDTVLTDCDGVLWMGNDIISTAPDVMNRFKSMGKKVFYVTNNSTKTRDEFVQKCKALGFNSTKEEIVSTAHLTANYLKSQNFNKKVYIVGSSGIAKELDNVGIKNFGVGPDPMTTNMTKLVTEVKLEPDVGAVVVGFDEHFSLPKMLKAATYLEQKGSLFIATNTDERFPTDTHIMPGTGSFVAAIRTCAERDPVIMGKPEAYIREYLIKEHKIDPSRTLMIGDRCNTDILLGTRCGFQTLLVLTGVTKLEEAKKWKESKDKDLNDLVPDYFTEKIGDLLPHM
ncbi:glycerol-3-phosphate phosphatase-like [Macrosteles quadrilineatus]|uniref:glycerol-3-phosphate phosphatase-like n=1 Tax=Macrosteles quadrilineatus TaxID=74068 RepID=UPI0023E235F6|nr:glycerol-3-phosphate phosphatase-like [Macrosteles quadrilineatus]XP_054267946.1 glycerol-3-phosphate phosphatase-like [Macrosteles quadrilineatus]